MDATSAVYEAGLTPADVLAQNVEESVRNTLVKEGVIPEPEPEEPPQSELLRSVRNEIRTANKKLDKIAKNTGGGS